MFIVTADVHFVSQDDAAIFHSRDQIAIVLHSCAQISRNNAGNIWGSHEADIQQHVNQMPLIHLHCHAMQLSSSTCSIGSFIRFGVKNSQMWQFSFSLGDKKGVCVSFHSCFSSSVLFLHARLLSRSGHQNPLLRVAAESVVSRQAKPTYERQLVSSAG